MLTTATADSNEALVNAKTDLEEKRTRRRERHRRNSEGAQDEGKTQEEIMAEQHVEKLAAKVERLTEEAEAAMRTLVDYSDELGAQDLLVATVVENASRQVPPWQRRQRSDGEGEDEDMPDADEVDILSPTELLKQATDEYIQKYGSRSMTNRYSKNKHYEDFKKILHETTNGDTVPLPPTSEWFTADGAPRLRGLDAADTPAQAEESDEDLQITGGVTSLKCPLTLQTFKHPYSNHVCSHTFEKSAILEMMATATVFYDNPQQRGRARGPGVKKLKCPTPGCDKMLEEKGFYDDEIKARMVKRELAKEARERERELQDSESEEDVRGKSAKPNRRETLDLDAQMRIERETLAKMEPQEDE